MSRKNINIGSRPNDGTGDPIRTAFDKVNQNFIELYEDGVGVSGFSGYSGKSGYSGVIGTSGTSGTSGASGVGLSGYSGISGASGSSGVIGTSGTSGASGVGLSGYSGISGASGSSGTSGAGVPLGGNTNNFLVKASNTNFDVKWSSLYTVSNTVFNSTLVLDASSNNIFDVILTGNVTVGFTGGNDAFPITVRLRQDSVGGRTITFDSSVRLSNSVSTVTLSSTPNKLDYLNFRYNSVDNKYDLLAYNLGF